MYICRRFNTPLHLIPILIAKYKETGGGTRLLHSIGYKQISFCDQEFCTNLAVYLITVIATVKKHMSGKIT